MEPNGKRRPSTMHNKGELEKFSRRLIRAVARMLLHEKRNEAEVWEGLKKQTGFDCKTLWNRMYALTIKKLDRLLNVEDQVDRLPVAARMTITDWLLFDTVIAHQDIDVIGMTITSTEDKKVLVDLFELVEKYRLEFLAGDQLADAWSAATVQYNKDNRQCTPMLLQRRWYQLKLATRARFYKFWSVYKGVFKRLGIAEPYKPTPLQTTIATRYKPLVVTQFMAWETLIQNKLVILPEEFEIKGLEKQEVITENSPDVMCLEPDVETINLDDDSDMELEYRKSPQNDDLATVTVKQEPRDDEMDIDENTPYQNRQDKITHCAEAVMEATITELEEIDLADDIETFITSNEEGEENTRVSDDKEIILESKQTMQGKTSILQSCLTKGSGVIDDQGNKPLIIGSKNENIVDLDNNDVIITDNATVEEDVEFVKVTKGPELALPQITSVFGGFNDSSENLAKISLLTSQVTNNINDVVLQKDSNSNVSLKTVIGPSGSSFGDGSMKTLDSINNIDDDTTSKPLLSPNSNLIAQTLVSKPDTKPHVSKNMWFGELSNDIDFVDDGIQLIDDGIAYQDEEASNEVDGVSIEKKIEIKIEGDPKSIEDNTNNENNTFDKKLLMVPVIYTVKLEDMGVLTADLLNHVNDKSLIDVISSKSKVVIKELDAISDISENVTTNLKRVKLSSYMLHKPRSRTYNPIQLCKNPDFNTRLKRLSVGFFSSSRNRLLFKACKPVTIDVSKAFEDRIVNGTMYLDEGNLDVEDSCKEIDTKKNQENTSVLPSALPAQSLIDNTKGEIVPILCQPINTKILEVSSLACERKKVINLPDITEVRRINQNLLTAQVTPIQCKNDVSALNNQATASPISLNDNITTSKAGPASRKRAIDAPEENAAVNLRPNNCLGVDSNTSRNKELWKTGYKVVPWKSRQIRPEVSWINFSGGIYTPDTLLALDALNKMLCILTEGAKDFAIESKSKKKKYKVLSRSGIDGNDKRIDQSEDTDEVQVIDETPNGYENNKTKNNVATVTKGRKKSHCCWARGRIHQLKLSRKRTAKHLCPFPLCLCCCKYQLLEYYNSIRELSKNEEKLSGWVNLLNIEAKHDAQNNKANKEKKDIAVDVAELIPINTATSKSVTTSENETAQNLVQETINKTDVILCHAESISSEVVSSDKLTVDELPTHCDKSIQDQLENNSDDSFTLGANVSVMTSEGSSAAGADLANDKTPTADVDINYSAPLKKPRIRIESYSRHSNVDKSHQKQKQKSVEIENIESQEEIPVPPLQHIKVTANQRKLIAVNVSNINIAKKIHPEGIVKVRNNLERPENTFKIKKHITENSNPSQRMIYLNSKQIAELPSDNPIHLGKNKILLTNLKFPPNFKAFESYQRNLRQTMALPKGIRLILQPDGRLNYTIDRGAIISKEFIAAMPLLISAIQQQIDSTSIVPSSTVPPLKPYSNNEIICLSDEETLDANVDDKKESSKKSSGIPLPDYQNTLPQILSLQPEQQMHFVATTNSADDCSGEKSLTVTEIESATNCESSISANVEESTKNENMTEEVLDNSTKNHSENVNFELNENGQEDNSVIVDDLQMTHKCPETEDTIQNNESLSNDINNSKNTQLEINSESLEKSNENIDKEVKDNESKANINKTKNILSDLMAMSGISPTTFTQELPLESYPGETITDQLPIEEKISTSLVDVLNLPQNSKTILHTQPTELQYTLTPITSLSELKYACIHKGSFYKLDLETRLLLPINVCMKNILEKPRELIRKNPRMSSTTETMIDLTNDDAPDEPTISRNNSVLIINEPNESENCEASITVTDNSGETDNNEYIDHSQNTAANTVQSESLVVENVKPIKLFSVAPSILKRKLHDVMNRVIDTQNNQNSTTSRRAPRKSLLKYLDQEAIVNNYSLNPKFGQLSFEGGNSGVDDSSSDEETLANIATRKRQMEKALQDGNLNNGQSDLPVNKLINTADAPHETVGEMSCEAEESMNPAEVVMEYLDEGLLNENDQDGESCILGV